LDFFDITIEDIKPDVVVVSEHGFSYETETFFKLNNFDKVSIYCRQNYKLGGVALFCKQEHQCSDLNLNFSSEKDFEVSGMFVSTTEMKKIVIIGLYRSPIGNFLTFLKKFEQLLEMLFLDNSSFVIIGDFNINVLDINNNNVKRFKDLLQTFNLKWELNTPTRITEHSATAIDNVITNLGPRISVEVIDTQLSDHHGQVVSINSHDVKLNTPHTEIRRNFKDNNIVKLKRLLHTQNWQDLYVIREVDEAYNYFRATFLNCLDEVCPFKTVKMSGKKIVNDWFTNGMLVSKRNLKMYRELNKTSTSQEFKTFLQNYNRIYKKVIRAAKSLSIRNKIKNSHNMSKTAWQIINDNKSFKVKKHI
jgi:hypothetical protein